MKAFRFPLEKVLGWRHLQMRAEEEKLAVLQQQLEVINRRAEALASAELNSKWRLVKMASVPGEELHALASFQERLRREKAALSVEGTQLERRIDQQRLRLLKARKDYCAIEKLRERRMKAWTYAYNRELENNAAEAHLSRLSRGEA